MKITKQVFLGVIVVVAGLGVSFQALADKSAVPLRTVISNVQVGTVDAIYRKNRNEIVISDQSFGISPTLAVRSVTGQLLGGLALLGSGYRIAYRTAVTGAKGQEIEYVIETWLVPANFSLPED